MAINLTNIKNAQKNIIEEIKNREVLRKGVINLRGCSINRFYPVWLEPINDLGGNNETSINLIIYRLYNLDSDINTSINESDIGSPGYSPRIAGLTLKLEYGFLFTSSDQNYYKINLLNQQYRNTIRAISNSLVYEENLPNPNYPGVPQQTNNYKVRTGFYLRGNLTYSYSLSGNANIVYYPDDYLHLARTITTFDTNNQPYRSSQYFVKSYLIDETNKIGGDYNNIGV